MSKEPIGIAITPITSDSVKLEVDLIFQWCERLQIAQYVELYSINQNLTQLPNAIRLTQSAFNLLTPGFNTIDLTLKLEELNDSNHLTREILLALFASPISLDFLSYQQLKSAVRVRENIVRAAKMTALDFNTSDAAERPEEYWTYSEVTGFILRQGKNLIEALISATQPNVSGQLYSFSCYRATEYIILLAIAQEAREFNPLLYSQLEKQWQKKAIMSGRFHDVFLCEYGTVEDPLPIQYYVPGDRIWFKNPDDNSSDIEGYEGSWVFYLGQGKFPDFWKLNHLFSVQSKCIEIYHWRHGAYRNDQGELLMDEDKVERYVSASLSHTQDVKDITERMFKLRDPQGIYADGGCMDRTREVPRNVIHGFNQVVWDI